jgi:hypothetical protein
MAEPETDEPGAAAAPVGDANRAPATAQATMAARATKAAPRGSKTLPVVRT